MHTQKSYSEEKPTLYVVATPIGNLDDMTFRAVKTLKEVDVIFAEDTRHSGSLLKHFDIKTPMISYHQHNERMRNEEIIKKLQSGESIALISDAGTPLINDPGTSLVKAVINARFHVVSIPGASAFLTSLVASPYQTHPFLFYGFLPAKDNAKKTTLKSLKRLPYTLIFYEAPHRIKETLHSAKDIFGNRQITIARELTKKYEEYRHLTLEEIDDIPELKGEMVLIIEGANEAVTLNKDDAIDHIELLIDDGLSEKEAIKKASKDRNMKKNDVYMAYQIHKKNFKEKE